MSFGVVATAKVTLKVTPTLTWYSESGYDLKPPAGKVTIAQQTYHTTDWQIPYSYSYEMGTATANPVHESPLPGGRFTLQDSPASGYYRKGLSSSIVLIQRDNSARETVIRLNEVTISTSNEVTPSEGTRTQANVAAAYKVWVNPRMVAISRVDAPTPKQKGAPDITIDTAKDEWIDVDGTGHGQSRWSHRAYAQYPTGGTDFGGNPQTTFEWRDENNRQIFKASRLGTWTTSLDNNPPRSWIWTPTTAQPVDQVIPSGTDEQYNVQFMPKGNHEKFYGDWRASGTGAPADFKVEYQLTDNADGATAKAKYIVHLHHEWENWREEKRVQITNTLPKNPTKADWAGSNATPTVVTWSAAQEAGVELGVGLSGGFSIGGIAEFGGNVSAAASNSVSADEGIEITVPAGRMSRRIVIQTYKRVHALVDHYVPSGYDRNPAREDGSWPQQYNDRSTISNQRNFFTLPNSDPNGHPEKSFLLYGDYNGDGTVDPWDNLVN